MLRDENFVLDLEAAETPKQMIDLMIQRELQVISE